MLQQFNWLEKSNETFQNKLDTPPTVAIKAQRKLISWATSTGGFVAFSPIFGCWAVLVLTSWVDLVDENLHLGV